MAPDSGPKRCEMIETISRFGRHCPATTHSLLAHLLYVRLLVVLLAPGARPLPSHRVPAALCCQTRCIFLLGLETLIAALHSTRHSYLQPMRHIQTAHYIRFGHQHELCHRMGISQDLAFSIRATVQGIHRCNQHPLDRPSNVVVSCSSGSHSPDTAPD